jgi:hypothetical protein
MSKELAPYDDGVDSTPVANGYIYGQQLRFRDGVYETDHALDMTKKIWVFHSVVTGWRRRDESGSIVQHIISEPGKHPRFNEIDDGTRIPGFSGELVPAFEDFRYLTMIERGVSADIMTFATTKRGGRDAIDYLMSKIRLVRFRVPLAAPVFRLSSEKWMATIPGQRDSTGKVLTWNKAEKIRPAFEIIEWLPPGPNGTPAMAALALPPADPQEEASQEPRQMPPAKSVEAEAIPGDPYDDMNDSIPF